MENSKNTRLTGMLGFAMRAGKVVIGTDLVCRALSKRDSGRPRIVLITSSASEGTKNKIIHKCEFYGIKAIDLPFDSAELGRLLGKLYAPAAVAIIDDGFAREIAKAIGEDDAQRDDVTSRKDVSQKGNR